MAHSQAAGRRYAAAMTVYVTTLVAVVLVMHSSTWAAPLRWALAVLPALPILFIIWAMGRYVVEEGDEVIRAKMIQQLLWGAATALSVSTLWGFLESLGGLPHLPAYWVFPLFCLGMILAIPYLQRKYG